MLMKARPLATPILAYPAMAYHPRWVPKYRPVWKPSHFDNIHRRWDSREKTIKKNFRTSDPLWFDHDQEHLNGGVALLLEQLHDKGNYQLPIKNQAFLLYNMQLKGVYDPLVYQKFEASLKDAASANITARHAYGALCAYYQSN